MQLEISFNQQALNQSIQVGDNVWVLNIDSNGLQNGEPELVGEIIDINVGPGGNIDVDMFLLFSKPIQVNESGLKGYYADVTFTNTSKEYAELFAISSEVVVSSK